MKRADGAGRRIAQAMLLAASALLLAIFAIMGTERMQKADGYTAAAPEAQVTLQAGLPQNWLPNAADADTLSLLPGIGPVLAERIVLAREQDGLFFFPEDLIAVKGIGTKTLQNIQVWLEENPDRECLPVIPAADHGAAIRNLPE